MKRHSDDLNPCQAENDVSIKKKLKVDENAPNTNSKEQLKDRKFSTVNFSVSPPDKFDKQFPYFREPCEIGSFSQDSERKFCADKRQLKYFCRPPLFSNVEFDLKIGYEEMIKRDESTPEYINDLLRWITTKPQAFQIPSEKPSISENATHIASLNTDFVSWRGLLTKLVCSPYENLEGWKIAIIYYKNTYFLCEFMTEDRKKQIENTTERQNQMSYWGWKFEQYVTSESKDGRPDTSKPVNTNEAFCTVVRSRLGNHSLVYGCEVDGIDENINGPNKYIEFKTSRLIETKRQNINFKRFKLIKYWAQSFLVGISKILCGFRDDDGIVRKLEEFDTQKIPDNLQDIWNPWKPNICFNFLDYILNRIKSAIKEDDCRTVYLMEWSPKNNVTIVKTSDEQYQFLPEWFVKWDRWQPE